MEEKLNMTTDAVCAGHALATPRPARGFSEGLLPSAGRFLQALARMRARARMQRMLASADHRLFADLGVSRAQAAFEASRPSGDSG
jgi:uncharacterized protein YjiS (DUF1127 family)